MKSSRKQSEESNVYFLGVYNNLSIWFMDSSSIWNAYHVYWTLLTGSMATFLCKLLISLRLIHKSRVTLTLTQAPTPKSYFPEWRERKESKRRPKQDQGPNKSPRQRPRPKLRPRLIPTQGPRPRPTPKSQITKKSK